MASHKYISCDDHLLEAPDTYSKRAPARLKDVAPHIENIEGADVWFAEGAPIRHARLAAVSAPATGIATAGVKKVTYEKIRPGVWKAEERLQDYDRAGVYAAALFPDMLPGFSGNPFSSIKDTELRRFCVRAYNDRLAEDFYAVNPKRFIPIGILPAWSVTECVEEVRRIARIGHKGVLWGGLSDIFGYPWMGDPYWFPLWETIQDMDIVLCLHQQSAAIERIKLETGKIPENMRIAMRSCHKTSTIQPTQELLLSGILEKFPSLRVLLAESGVGWLPFVLQMHDRDFKPNEYLKMKPSEYFRRQCVGGFWRERVDDYILDICGEDNIAWEQDYPHAVSTWPESDESIEYSLANVKDETVRQKILWRNSARLFKLDIEGIFSTHVNGERAY